MAADGTASPCFHTVALSGFMDADTTPADYIVDGLLPAGHVTLLGAHGGAGKSMLGLAWAAHVACGTPWNRREVEYGRAVFCSLEDDARILTGRLRRIAHAYDLDAYHIERNLIVLDGTAGDGALAAEVVAPGMRTFGATRAFEELRERCAGARLIVVDNASDAFDASENDRRHVRGFVRMLAKLARENDAAMLLLAHIDKAAAKFGASGNAYSGSTAWHNSARSRFALIASENNAVELRQEKHNLGRLADPIPLGWNDEGVLVPIRGGAFVPSARDAEDDAAILDALRTAERSYVIVPAARTGPATAQNVLATLGLPDALIGGKGRPRFWRAVDRMIVAGSASSEDYKNAYSKPRTRIRLA